jgi:hypothetical protein
MYLQSLEIFIGAFSVGFGYSLEVQLFYILGKVFGSRK